MPQGNCNDTVDKPLPGRFLLRAAVPTTEPFEAANVRLPAVPCNVQRFVANLKEVAVCCGYAATNSNTFSLTRRSRATYRRKGRRCSRPAYEKAVIGFMLLPCYS
jgi:hypothetical protein